MSNETRKKTQSAAAVLDQLMDWLKKQVASLPEPAMEADRLEVEARSLAFQSVAGFIEMAKIEAPKRKSVAGVERRLTALENRMRDSGELGEVTMDNLEARLSAMDTPEEKIADCRRVSREQLQMIEDLRGQLTRYSEAVTTAVSDLQGEARRQGTRLSAVETGFINQGDMERRLEDFCAFEDYDRLKDRLDAMEDRFVVKEPRP